MGMKRWAETVEAEIAVQNKEHSILLLILLLVLVLVLVLRNEILQSLGSGPQRRPRRYRSRARRTWSLLLLPLLLLLLLLLAGRKVVLVEENRVKKAVKWRKVAVVVVGLW